MEKSQLKISIISIGGAGTNMINRIIETTESENIDFITISTALEELNQTKAKSKLLIGEKLTKGLGTFGNIDIGKKSVEQNKKQIVEFLERELKNTNIVFIVTGLGGGTGTGVTPLIEEIIRKMGVVIIGIVTIPFSFEEEKRIEQAKKGKEQISKNVDLLISVPSDNFVYRKVKSIIQTFKDLDDSVRHNVQEISNILLSSNIENFSYKNLRNFIEENIC